MWQGGGTHGAPYIFCLLLKKRKSTRASPILKSNSTFWFKKNFKGWKIKKKLKRGKQILRKGLFHIIRGVDVTELKWAGWRYVIPPCCVDKHLAFEEGGDSVQEGFFLLFISQHLLFYSSKYYSLSFHHRNVKQIAFCSAMPLQIAVRNFLNYCT